MSLSRQHVKDARWGSWCLGLDFAFTRSGTDRTAGMRVELKLDWETECVVKPQSMDLEKMVLRLPKVQLYVAAGEIRQAGRIRINYS